MKTVAVAVKDLAAQTFGRPWFVNHENAAIRTFTDEVNRAPEQGSQSDLFSHPDDFELYACAQYDDATGVFTPYDAPKLLVQAKHVSQRPSGGQTPIVHLNGGLDAKSVSL